MPKRKAPENPEAAKKAKMEESIEKLGLSWSREGEGTGGAAGAGDIMVLSGELWGREKIVGFDIDYTIIQTKSGRTFPTGPKDWKWLYPEVPAHLKALHEEGNRVVFFTNQAGIEKNKSTPKELMSKFNDIVTAVGVPIYVVVCTGMNKYRKPNTMMWRHLVDECNNNMTVKLKQCMYVGDAAGRAKQWAPGKPKDFSCGDRMFAANVGIEFKTPEEFFLKEAPAKFKWQSINPVNFLEKFDKEPQENQTYHSKSQEMILLHGPPASGKSTFTKRHLVSHGYVSINRDTLKTPAKCIKVAQEAVDNKKSVAIDNTNPAKAIRADYIKIAKRAGIPCRCFMLETPLELAHHLNWYRTYQTGGTVRRIPDVAYNMYKSKYEQPEQSEGFTEIKRIDFVPQFDSAEDKDLFKQWTC